MLIIILILGEKSNLPASFTLRRDKTVAHYGQSLAKSADSSSVEYGYTLPRFRLDLAATLPRTASTGRIAPFAVAESVFFGESVRGMERELRSKSKQGESEEVYYVLDRT